MAYLFAISLVVLAVMAVIVKKLSDILKMFIDLIKSKFQKTEPVVTTTETSP